MTWSAPPTAVFQQAPPYTWWNTYIRDNLLETAPAKATTAGSFFVATGANAIAERLILQGTNENSSTTTSTTYGDLVAGPGPAVTITTGTQALVWINATLANSASSTSAASFDMTGASTIAANNAWNIQQDGGTGTLNRYSSCTLITGLTSGSNIFTMRYLVSSGATTGTFSRRRIQVLGL
jgi:hypothetical protein